MRGYDALILVDASRQGEEPGTLFVIEPQREEFAGSIEDGEMIDPHGMDPHTVLRLRQRDRRLAGQGRRDRLRARRGRRRGLRRSRPSSRRRSTRGADARARDDRRAAHGRGVCMSSRSARRSSTRPSAMRRAAGDAWCACASGALRQVVPDSLDFYFGIVSRDTRLRRRAAGAGADRRRGCAARTASASGRSTCRRSAARRATERRSRSCRGRGAGSGIDRCREEEPCIA